ncbi:macrophage mannose receptor 1 isoform X1 [Silurus asotus]|uniref:Macrophage mannose receptor 1 isoform X1 n=1 Tax=Silurus asotus TaxID=30991 RepID=A0AAD5FLI3_SILAS|nr:macrophage mannose receptor 1 isoform X1 [Silurus asotus]
MTSFTWSDAQDYCRAKYTDLAVIQSDTDWLRLKKEPGLVKYTSWVGLYNDINGWRWSLDDLPLKSVTYTNWYPGEPNNYNGIESCVAMSSYSNWWDVPCSQLRPVICYNAKFSGTARFVGISSPWMTWPQAQAYCRTYHTDLASSLNSSDNDLIMQVRNTVGDAWIGLYRDAWKWVDGTIASDLKWMPGEPNNYGGNENCGVVTNGLFGDRPCSNIFFFFCDTIAVSILGTVPHNYELIKTPMTWANAKNYCRVWYTDLAAIQSGTDWLRLKKEAVSKGLATPAWVGLYADINGWRWSLNNLQYVPFRPWYPGEPNNAAGKESCVAIGGYNCWWDVPCTQLRPIICYDDNLTGSARFIAIPRPYMTWPEAQAYCRTHYTDLASIFNSSDNNIIGKINPGGAWIGLYREPWRWSEGTSALNLSWAAGQPDNYGGIENCAVVNNRLFSDSSCSNQYYFFCHTSEFFFHDFIKINAALFAH